MKIVIANRQRKRKINVRLLKRIIEALLDGFKIENAEIGFNLVAEREMILINETFLKHKGSTDVVTFNYKDESNGKDLAGEIFVCVDEAILQSKKFKTTWQSEIIRYVVHGILHLLGHDDLRAAARRAMKREENRQLRCLAIKFSLAQIGGGSKLRA